MMKKNANTSAPVASPGPGASKGTKTTHETDVETLVKIQFETLNGKPFYGQVTDDELIYIWVKVFNRKKDELFGVVSTKSLTRNVRATFKLNSPIKIHEVFECAEFQYEKFMDDGGSDVITGKILGLGSKPAAIGDLVTVTVKTNFGVKASGVLAWLKLFGTVSAKCEFKINPSTGLRTDVFEAELVLKTHIDEYLPMYGQKAQVNYSGIPRMCNRCYSRCHMLRDCNNKKKDWVNHIADLLDAGLDAELIGTWQNAVSRWKDANKKD